MIFFMSNGLGDLIMTSPALNSYLKSDNKKKTIIILSRTHHIEALKLLVPGKYLAYALDRSVFELIKLCVRLIFARGPIVAPALSSKRKSLIGLCLLGKKIYTNSRAAFSIPGLVIRLEMNMYDKGLHQVNYYINFLSTVTNIKMSKLNYMPHYFDKNKSVKNVIPIIVLGISSGTLERNKIPSPGYFANFVNRLSLLKNCHYLIVSSPDDCEVIQEFRANVQKDVCITELKNLALRELVNIIKYADLAISGTTGQGHIFSLCNIPMLVFSGVTDFNQSGPFVKVVNTISHQYPCGPCYDQSYRFGCGRNCMNDINTEQAVHDALEILNKSHSLEFTD
jgi:hypothetical protein